MLIMIEWKSTKGFVGFKESEKFMEQRVEGIINNNEAELIWFLEHDPFYTFGKSAQKEDLIDPNFLPCYEAKRGGSYTYHGPGQRIVYIMLNIKNYGSDVRKFVWMLEEWIIKTINEFNIIGKRIKNRVGVWVEKEINTTKEINIYPKKIAAIGLRIKKWVSFYGISINLSPNLKNYDGIIACGNKGFGVTSFDNEGIKINFSELDIALKKNFYNVFH